MKKSFDEEIKNRLKDIEMPYDASAWKTMSDNLDKKRGKPSSNKYKWLIPVISLITISSLSIYLYTNNNLSTNENKIIKNIVKYSFVKYIQSHYDVNALLTVVADIRMFIFE